MSDPTFWDRLSAEDGGPIMTHRQASQLLRAQRIYCRVRQDGEDVIATHGTRDLPAPLYDLALKVHFGYEPALPEPYTTPRRPRAKATRRTEG